MADFSPLAYLYSAGIVFAVAGGCWAVWWLAIRPAIEWWIARHCPLAPDPADAAVDRWHTELPEVAPCPPLTAAQQAVLDALDFNPRPRPGQIRRSKP